jgi:hypothetical protein
LNVSENARLVEVITSSPDTVLAATSVEAVMRSVRDALAARLSVAVMRCLPGWDVTSESVFSESRTGVSVSRPGSSGSIDFYLYGPLDYYPWVGIPKKASRAYAADKPGKAQGNWRWWRLLEEEDLGVPSEELYGVAPETLAPSIAKIARACWAGGRA